MRTNKLSKLLACILAVALIIGCVPMAGLFASAVTVGETVLEDVNFDENNIVLSLGAISDQHITYSAYKVNTVTSRIQTYANQVATLDAAANHQLDAIVSCGDYTSTGCYIMANNYASATKAIMDAINVGKADGEKTRFMFSYGNHDTSWTGCMPISTSSHDYATRTAYYANEGNTWESVLNEYGLLADQGAQIVSGMEGEGCYVYEVPTSAGSYYVLSLETDTYNYNVYTDKALAWLDSTLATLTANAPNKYVYILSHAPIKESGVYGADLDFDKNASWGARDASKDANGTIHEGALDDVLKKYSQVVYMSGHTHYGNELESTIMSKNYTAITLSALTADLYTGSSGYIGGTTGRDGRDFVLLIQVDANGNQRIKRILTNASTVTMNITTEGEMVANPVPGDVANAAEIASVRTTSATVNAGGSVVYYEDGPVWLMPTPNPTSKTHLQYLSALRGEGNTPTFASGAKPVVTTATYAASEGLSCTFTFPAATSRENIIFYQIDLYATDNSLLGTYWATGNYNYMTDGVLTGTTHKDATEFRYSISGVVATEDDFIVAVTAVDEYGNKSAKIYSDAVTPDYAMTEPSLAQNQKNYFDDVSNHYWKAGQTSLIEFTSNDDKKLISTHFGLSSITSGDFTKVHYYISPEKYFATVGSPRDSWAPSKMAQAFTPFDLNDTYVYEATFKCDTLNAGGFIAFTTRLGAEYGTWKDNYQGVYINASGVYYYTSGNTARHKNTSGFKLSADGQTHHITIVSSATALTCWIDGTKVLNNVDISIGGVDMYPCLITRVNYGDYTVTEQKAYYYDFTKIKASSISATAKNIFSESDVQYAPYGTNTVATFTKEGFNGYKIVNECTAYQGGLNVTITPATAFSTTDQVTWEYTYKATKAVTDDTRGYAETYMYLRKNGSNKKVSILMRTNGQFGLCVDGKYDLLSGYRPLPINCTTTIKVVADNEKISLWLGGIKVYDNKLYTSVNDTYDTTTAAPCLFSSFMGIHFTVIDSIVTVEDGNHQLDGVKAGANLLYSGNANVTTSMNTSVSGFKYAKGSAYLNMYCDYLRDHGSTSYYSGNNIYLFGGNNANFSFDKSKSYILSANVAKSNNSTPPYSGSGNYTSRLAFSLGYYNGSEVWCFYQDGTFYYYDGVSVTNSKTTVGFGNYDYFRYTASLTPFGYKIYINGTEVGGWDFPDPDLFTPNMMFRVNGTQAFLNDIVFAENTDYSCYVNKINNVSTKIASYGEWGTSTVDGYQAIIAASVLTATNYTSGTATGDAVKTAYNNIKAVDDGFSVPNNYLVRDGVTFSTIAQYAPVFTSTSNGFTLDQSQAGCDSVNETNVNVDRPVYFDGLNVTTNDTYVVEFDYVATDAISTSDPRIKLVYGNVAGKKCTMMIQGSTVYKGPNNESWASIGSLPAGIGNGSGHIKFTVDGDTGITLEYYCSAGYKKMVWNFADSFSGDYVAEPAPCLEFKKQNITVSNLYVGTDVEDKYDEVKGNYDAIKASYTGSYSTTVDAATALNSVKAVLDKGYKVATIAELSAAATTLQSLKNSLTVKNNWILDGTLSIATTGTAYQFTKKGDADFTMDLSKTANTKGQLPSIYTERNVTLKNGTSQFASDAAYVVDFDVTISDACDTNVRLTFVPGKVNNYAKRVMIQDSSLLLTNATDGFTGNVKSVPNLRVGGSFHVTYKVNPARGVDFKIVNLANNKEYTYFVDYTEQYGADYTFTPEAYLSFRSAKFDVSNLYVGYDLDVYKTALQAEVDGIAVADLSGYSDATVKAYNDALTEVNGVITNYKNYSKDEIVGAAAPLTTAKANLKEASAINIGVNVGGDDMNTYKVGLGETLITKEKIGTKFIIGWKNNDGEDVTTYDGSTVTPEFIETEMLHVFKQFHVEDNGKVVMRLLAAVDTLDRYKSVTWTFSLNDATFAKPAVRESTKVYGAVMENGNKVKPSEKFASFASTAPYVDYANYFMYFDIFNISASKFSDGTIIYAHANVTLDDNTVVDGSTYKIELANYAEIFQK